MNKQLSPQPEGKLQKPACTWTGKPIPYARILLRSTLERRK